jgi:hypothetical protein
LRYYARVTHTQVFTPLFLTTQTKTKQVAAGEYKRAKHSYHVAINKKYAAPDGENLLQESFGLYKFLGGQIAVAADIARLHLQNAGSAVNEDKKIVHYRRALTSLQSLLHMQPDAEMVVEFFDAVKGSDRYLPDSALNTLLKACKMAEAALPSSARIKSYIAHHFCT